MRQVKLVALLFTGLILSSASILYSQPDTFSSFEVQPGAGCTILIQWEAFPGMDSLKYEVERSNDMKNWKMIAHVNVKPSHKYLVLDTQPADSLNFYRVKQVGNKSTFLYSQIKWIQLNRALEIFTWPNLAKDMLRIMTPFLSGTIDIIDVNGQLIRNIIIVDFITTISISGLTSGIYFLHIRHGDLHAVQKLVKE